MEVHYDFEKPIEDLERRIAGLREASSQVDSLELQKELSSLEKKLKKLMESTYSKLSPWQRVQLSRHPNRPQSMDYIERIFSDFFELHGDRKFRDDTAIIAGLARFRGRSVLLIAQQKGRGTKEKIKRNFGMAKPEGYRKAIRLMELAERFSLPVITFVDTPGAYPGMGAEKRGQSEAIAESMLKMFSLHCPIISVLIGEGGSGGALALAVGDRILMQEFSTYSVISPESCASILWSSTSEAEKAASVLKMSALDIKKIGVVEEVVPEPPGGAHRDYDKAAELLANHLESSLKSLLKKSSAELRSNRIEYFHKIGSAHIVKEELGKPIDE